MEESTSSSSRRPTGSPRARALFACGLVVATLAAYGQVGGFDFVRTDDPLYVRDNPHVAAGLTTDGLIWAFTTTTASNWHPLTWISLMLDVEIAGPGPRWLHLSNLLFHIANTLLLFVFLARATGRDEASAFVAALFALHPLHVESVAWVTERKDVLSTLFWFLALLFYARYVERPGVTRYALTTGAFVLGLLAKPMVVTLPATLLLLDLWPFRRLGERGVLREKIPFFVLSGISCALTLWAGKSAIGSSEAIPLATRLANATYSYVAYLADTVWPSGLSIFYPYPTDVPVSTVLLCAALLAGVTGLVLRAVRESPVLAAGWLWFLVTLLPVIGLVQVGEQARADRYTYVPLVGIFVLVAWTVPDLLRRPVALRAGAGLVVLALGALTFVQAGHWRDSVALFSHAVRVDEKNVIAHNGLAAEWLERGEPERAIRHYESALAVEPRSFVARANLARALERTGRLDEALTSYDLAIELSPADPDLLARAGALLTRVDRMAEAVSRFEEALGLDPDHARSHAGLGYALGSLGRIREAIPHLERAVALDPGDAVARKNLETLRRSTMGP